MKKLTLVLAIVFCSPLAKANFHFEPYVGYEFASSTSYKLNGATNNSLDADLTGVLYGVKLGYRYNQFTIGVDTSLSNISADYGSTGVNDDWTATDLGIFVGFDSTRQFSILFSYSLLSTLAIDGLAVDYEGSALRAGLAYHFNELLALSIHYNKRKYDSLSAAVSGVNSVDLQLTSVIAMLSFSFTF